MPHTIERAPSGRARCRACGQTITKETFRVGEPVPNLYADAEGAETTHWYHPECAAHRRPEAFLQALEASPGVLPDADALVPIAREGVAHRRLPRLDQASRAPSGRAACRECRAPIAKDTWRIALLFWQDGRFSPAGYVHVGCAGAYFETTALLDRLRRFSPALTDADAAELQAAIAAGQASGRSS
jgi:hypothetical protein